MLTHALLALWVVPGEERNHSCTACAHGQFAALPGALACQDCAAGKFAPEEGHNRSCYDCPNGFYQKKISQNACEELEEGFIAQAGGSSSAKVAPGYRINQSCIDTGESCREPTVPCPAGTRSTNVSSEYCVGCPIGWSSPGAAAQCTECNKGEYGAPLADSEFEGAISATMRVESLSRGDEQSNQCDKCPSGYSTGNKTGESSCLKNQANSRQLWADAVSEMKPHPSAYDVVVRDVPIGGTCKGPVNGAMWSVRPTE